MAEVHIIGTLQGASGFPASSLSCRWKVVAGEGWSLLEGNFQGATQTDIPEDDQFTVWSHPIDLHYATKTIAGWPKIQVQVFYNDSFGRNELVGYGFTHFPTTPGQHQLDISTWRPITSYWDGIRNFFSGSSPVLRNLEMIHTPADRFRLTTQTMGNVHLEIGIMLRNFEGYGVAF
ncbi:B9 domain-containing protein [Phlyctochytrium arcticum]|nr:B9 domain-containing protein [Phlyctochytrium arcticum]